MDPVTLDLIENALKNARFEMDEVVRRVSLSPVIREQHDEFPMICDAQGRMVVGQFGSYIPGVLETHGADLADGAAARSNQAWPTATCSSGTTPTPARDRYRTTTTGA